MKGEALKRITIEANRERSRTRRKRRKLEVGDMMDETD